MQIGYTDESRAKRTETTLKSALVTGLQPLTRHAGAVIPCMKSNNHPHTSRLTHILKCQCHRCTLLIETCPLCDE